jgi:hypothetical protein
MPLKKLIALFCAAVLLLSKEPWRCIAGVNKIYDVGINTDSAEGESDERIIVKYKDDTSTTTEHRVNDQFETAEAEKIDADSYVIIPEENVSTEELAEQFMSDSHVEYAERTMKSPYARRPMIPI